MASTQTIDPGALSAFIAKVYEGAGVPAVDAELVADTLVQADLWGHQSHGVLRTGWYLERLRQGAMKPVTEPEFVIDAGAVAVLDGRDGVGQVLTARAVDEAVRRAKAHGLGAVAVRNSNHFGTCMYYTLAGARQGCVTFLTTNGGPAMAPWGGTKKIVGTNPWSFAAPAGRHAPMVSDMANTGVARGKIYLARNKHQPIPEGWAIDGEGRPTTDPQAAIDGIILPMAGHKGYVISTLMDMMAGVLTGSEFLAGVNGPYKYDKKSGAGHFVIAMNVEAFQPLSEFNTRMERFIAELKDVPLAQGYEEVFYPGEMEARNDARFREEGVSLPVDTVADLTKIADEMNLRPLLPF